MEQLSKRLQGGLQNKETQLFPQEKHENIKTKHKQLHLHHLNDH